MSIKDETCGHSTLPAPKSRATKPLLVLEPVERAWIVVEPLRQELKLLALDYRIAVARRIKLGALRKMRDVTCDA